jgi:hypothetical protein
VSFIAQNRSEWIIQSKLAAFILASFGYLFFLMSGWSTGLGVFHHPGYCWVAGAFAVVALVVGSKPQRWAALAAFVVAILVGVYGYHENAVWREKIKKAESRKSAFVIVTGLSSL